MEPQKQQAAPEDGLRLAALHRLTAALADRHGPTRGSCLRSTLGLPGPGSASKAIGAGRIWEAHTDGPRAEASRSGSSRQPSSSSKRSCDPSQDGSSCGSLPAASDRGLVGRRTPPRRRQERHPHPQRRASSYSSYSTSPQAASTDDVTSARTQWKCSGPHSPMSRGTCPFGKRARGTRCLAARV